MNPLPNDEQPTPRTDAAIRSKTFKMGEDAHASVSYAVLAFVDVGFARQLERELAAAEKRLLEAEEDTRRLDWLFDLKSPAVIEVDSDTPTSRESLDHYRALHPGSQP